MKSIKEITVTVKYRAGLGGFKCSEEVYQELKEAFEECHEIDATGRGYDKASEWLSNHIRESDAIDISYEIDEFE